MREVPVDLVLRQPRELCALLLQLLGQLVGLRTVYQPTRCHEVVDVGLQRLVEGCIILPVDGLVGSDLHLWDGAEVDARDRPVGQYAVEEPPPFQDG